jgi:NADP-reducing hydrogenase subunit HndB
MMKSIEDLNKLREKARARMALRNGANENTRVTVAMGTCGIASGARDVLLAVVDELEQRGITDVAVMQSGCRGLCEREPMLEVQKKDMPPVTYGDLNAEKARTIVAQHVVQGVVVEQFVVTKGTRPEPVEQPEA